MSVINCAVSGRELNASVRVFRNLVVLWMMFLCMTFFIMLVAFSSKANAMEPLPLPKVTREIAPPEISVFSVPSKGMVADRCQSLLDAVRLEKGDVDRSETAINPSRRTAGNIEMVKTIKAYRQCRSQSALQELAAWRWSR